MKPQIKAARKAIAACRERGDGSLDLGGLGLDDESLRELLPEIIKLPPLKTLNLGLAGKVDSRSIDLTRRKEKPKSNALQNFPTELIEAQSQLILLNLRHNQLAALPEAIGGLAQLQRLSLETTSSRPCPSHRRPRQLQALARRQPARGPARGHRRPRPAASALAQHNQLAALPEAIGGLARLQTLSLHDNQLAALPEAIGGLAPANPLLDGNQLAALPEPSAASPGCKPLARRQPARGPARFHRRPGRASNYNTRRKPTHLSSHGDFPPRH